MRRSQPGTSERGLRLPWSLSDRFLPRTVLRPLQEFMASQTAGATVMLATAGIALLWANSPFRHSYATLWTTPASVRVGRWVIGEDLRGWVDEGLMTLFFLLAGLEIKREMVVGELADLRRALAPVVAAVVGMIVPALLFLGLVHSRVAGRGWGAAMPTDIALTLGVLALAGLTSSALRPFLLTLAIADDILTIVVIAVFYTDDLHGVWVLAAIACAGVVLSLNRGHVRATSVFVALGVTMWLCLRAAGVSPTLAGVAMGLLAPAVPFQRPRPVSAEARRIADETVDEPSPPDVDAPHWRRLAALSREAVSPLARIEHRLLPWVSYVVLPLFALANAGVTLTDGAAINAARSPVAWGIVVSRLVGKVAGIVGASVLVAKLGLARLPDGVGIRDLLGGALAASMAFTVSLFVAEIAYPATGMEIDAAKLGVLFSLVIGGTLGWVVLRRSARRSPIYSGRSAR
jgi:NhaA family Na+:H+ antiporter